MRGFVRRILVVALSAALAAGGAAFGSHAVPKAHAGHGPHAAHAAEAVDAAHAHHTTHAHHHADQASAVDEQPSTLPSDRADGTCCTMCVTASPLPPAFDGSVTVRITAVQFTERFPNRVGTTTRVDPGIPKSIV